MEILNKITEKTIYDIVYYQVATLLDESDYSAKYPLFYDWWIKKGDNTWGEESDNIWGYAIDLYNGHYITTINPFEYSGGYLALAKGEVDCVAAATNKIIEEIYENEDNMED